MGYYVNNERQCLNLPDLRTRWMRRTCKRNCLINVGFIKLNQQYKILLSTVEVSESIVGDRGVDFRYSFKRGLYFVLSEITGLVIGIQHKNLKYVCYVENLV